MRGVITKGKLVLIGAALALAVVALAACGNGATPSGASSSASQQSSSTGSYGQIFSAFMKKSVAQDWRPAFRRT